MQPIEHFVSGEEGEDEGVVSCLRWPIPPGVTRVYVEAYTQPGETVLLPYCQGVAEVEEVFAAQRRALALNFDPVLILVVKASLQAVPARELDAAVARLGDSPKQGVPLRRYLSDLYATTCPACERQVAADYFVWERDAEAPIAKQLRCPACTWIGQAGLDPEDRERLAEVPARGMHFFYVLDRVAPQALEGSLRSRLETWLKLYSPRSLYALAELTLKIEGLFPSGPLHDALKLLLLDCLDRCSALVAAPGQATSLRSRRSLTPPHRYLERNVWCTFEESVTRLRSLAHKPLAGLVDSVESFQTSVGASAPAAPMGFVGPGLVRDLRRELPPRSIGLVLFSPPALDSASWSLSYFWGAWLMGAEAAAPLRPLLRQRTPDPAWFAEVMAGSLHILADLLRDDGRLVLVLTGQRTAVVEALMLAASRARLGVVSLVHCGTDYRLQFAPTLPQPAAGPGRAFTALRPTLEAQIQETAVAAAADAIRMRGEPVLWLTLHAEIQRWLAQAGLLARTLDPEERVPSPLSLIAEQVRAALEDPALVQLEEDEEGERRWWLAEAGGLAPPLSDRVEAAACEILRDSPGLTKVDFVRAVYGHFPGVLAPDAGLVSTCLHAFGDQDTSGRWRLRPEDLPVVRQAEQKGMIQHLVALGSRLGYRAVVWPPLDVAWFKKGQVVAAFVVRWRAALGEVLALGDKAPGVVLHFVIPGGRSELVNYKLAHNPIWKQAVDEAGWRFIKYRHVRELLDRPDVDEYALRTIIGLDPIVERESVQLSLF